MTKKEMVNCIQIREQILKKHSIESNEKYGYFSKEAELDRARHQAIANLMNYMEMKDINGARA